MSYPASVTLSPTVDAGATTLTPEMQHEALTTTLIPMN